MPRPKKCRMILSRPDVRYFKPRGIPMKDLTEVYLTLEGCEAMRLVDLEGLIQEDAAKQMGVSRQTFGRILSDARKCVSEALINGSALRIEGGDFAVAEELKPSTAPESVRKNQYMKYPDQPLEPLTGGNLMRNIAVSAESPSLDDPIDPRFGRAAGFLIIDTDTFSSTYIDNGASQARAQGAGIQAAEAIARSGAKVVLTGYVGPKAFAALTAAGIQIIQNLDGLTVREAVEKYNNKELSPSSAPNSPGGRR